MPLLKLLPLCVVGASLLHPLVVLVLFVLQLLLFLLLLRLQLFLLLLVLAIQFWVAGIRRIGTGPAWYVVRMNDRTGLRIPVVGAWRLPVGLGFPRALIAVRIVGRTGLFGGDNSVTAKISGPGRRGDRRFAAVGRRPLFRI